MSRRLPMFPLGRVLLPHEPMALHVFEPRYRVLMEHVLAGDKTFGVVLIERGSEVGGGDQRSMMGTVATIEDALALDDGRWAVAAGGGKRIEIDEWLPDDPYPVAMVTERGEGRWPAGIVAAEELLATTEEVVRGALELKVRLDEPTALPNVALSNDPTERVWQLAAIAPLVAYDHQRLLCIDDPVERLGLLHELASDAVAVLAHRVQGL